jgi:hypothetical protein
MGKRTRVSLDSSDEETPVYRVSFNRKGTQRHRKQQNVPSLPETDASTPSSSTVPETSSRVVSATLDVPFSVEDPPPAPDIQVAEGDGSGNELSRSVAVRPSCPLSCSEPG